MSARIWGINFSARTHTRWINGLPAITSINRGLPMKLRGRFILSCTALALMGTGAALAGAAGSLTAASRIVQPIDESKLVTLAGGMPRQATAKNDRGAVADGYPLDHLYLRLLRSAQQEQALEGAIKELQDPHSATYHQWLTAEELGENYGPSRQDIGRVVVWLTSHGFQVNTVHKSGLTIDVSGTAGQGRDTFHTEIYNYNVNGTQHIDKASEAKIPAALAPVVAGFASLNDFMPKPLVTRPNPNFSFPCTGCPGGFNNAEQYDEAPADFATIYNAAPLYKGESPITGKGITVVVLEVTDVNPADVASFRSAFGLWKNSGTISEIHPGTGCSDPGTNGGEGEAALDSEWAGAVAPDANVELASCNNTSTSFGAFIAAQNLLDTAQPPHIMSISYGECEAENGPGLPYDGNSYVTELWRQAAAEG